MKEQYKPSEEEINKAESMVTDEQRELSKEREKIVDEIHGLDTEADKIFISLEEKLKNHQYSKDAIVDHVNDPAGKVLSWLEGKHPIEKVRILSEARTSLQDKYSEKNVEKAEEKAEKISESIGGSIHPSLFAIKKPTSGEKWLIDEMETTMQELTPVLEKWNELAMKIENYESEK